MKDAQPESVIAITQHTSFGLCQVLCWSAHRPCWHGFHRLPNFFPSRNIP